MLGTRAGRGAGSSESPSLSTHWLHLGLSSLAKRSFSLEEPGFDTPILLLPTLPPPTSSGFPGSCAHPPTPSRGDFQLGFLGDRGWGLVWLRRNEGALVSCQHLSPPFQTNVWSQDQKQFPGEEERK